LVSFWVRALYDIASTDPLPSPEDAAIAGMGCTLTVPVTVVTPGEDEKAEAGPTQTVAKNSSNRVFPLKPLPQQQEQEQETSHGGDEKDNIKKANPAIRQQGTFKSGDLALKGALHVNDCTHHAMQLKNYPNPMQGFINHHSRRPWI
jgi:hypothetical protein